RAPPTLPAQLAPQPRLLTHAAFVNPPAGPGTPSSDDGRGTAARRPPLLLGRPFRGVLAATHPGGRLASHRCSISRFPGGDLRLVFGVPVLGAMSVAVVLGEGVVRPVGRADDDAPHRALDGVRSGALKGLARLVGDQEADDGAHQRAVLEDLDE